jgi:hypothetical protein
MTNEHELMDGRQTELFLAKGERERVKERESEKEREFKLKRL